DTNLDILYTVADTNLDECWWSNNSGSTNYTLTACSNITEVTWNEGITNLIIYAKDDFENENSSTVTFTIDITPPSLSIISPPADYSFTTGTINLNFTVSDSGVGLDKCWYKNNTGNNITVDCSTNTTISQGSDGTYTIYIWSNDTLGNEAYDFHSWTVSTDAPAVNILNPFDNKIFNYDNNIWFNYTAEDGNGIDTCYLYGNWFGGWHINQTNTHNGDTSVDINEGNFMIPIIENGYFIWNVWCNDTAAPNKASWGINKTFTIDTIYPLIEYTNEVENNFINKSQNWIFINTSVVETNEKNITFYLYNLTGLINSTIYTNKIHLINFTNLANGIYYYNVTIYDKANHINLTETRKITLDYINPNATLFLPTNNTYLNLSLNNFTSNLIDNLGLKNVTLYIYNSTNLVNKTNITFQNNILNYYWNATIDLTDNVYSWFVKLFDFTGNSDTIENRTFTIDTISPNISITTISTVDNSQTFTFTNNVSDTNLDICYYTIYKDGDGIDGISENISFECDNITQATTTAYGDFVLKIYAKDKAEHISLTSQSFTTRYVNVGIGGGGGGGGGGTTVIVIGDEEVKWTVSTLSGGEKYQLDMFEDIDRSNVLNFENVGDKDVNIQLSCEDISINNNFCEFVSFSEDSFSLPVATDVDVPITVTISNVSKNLPKKTYTFNVVSIDDDNNRGVITYVVNYGSKNVIIKIITKMDSKFHIGDIDLPYWLLFIFISSILVTTLNFTIIKKFKLPTAMSFIIGIILGVVIILFI
ncbi:MAG: Ig-like domain-containing protein, partial [Promethearchaeia archaeon]